MAKPGRTGRRMAMLAAAAVCGVLLAGCAGPAATPAESGLANDVAALEQQVATQAAHIAGLETQAASGQQAAAQAGRITALETHVAQGLTSAAPTATNTSQPTATVVPAVAGLVTEGNTKGLASARVTITEYVDYF